MRSKLELRFTALDLETGDYLQCEAEMPRRWSASPEASRSMAARRCAGYREIVAAVVWNVTHNKPVNGTAYVAAPLCVEEAA